MTATAPDGVLVVGSISTDVTAYTDRLPARGETVLGSRVDLVLGGKGANQAVAAARYGAPTSMGGCVGRDPFAEIALAGLQDAGVQTSLVRRTEEATGVAHIRVDATGQNDIVIAPHANALVTADDVDVALTSHSSRARVLLLQLEVPADVTSYAARAGHDAGLIVVLDPAPAAQLDEAVWADVDLVTPNETEAALLTGLPIDDADAAETAAGWFVERGVRCVAITLGAAGAVLADASGARRLTAHDVEPLDTTAAGDAFTGVVGAALASGASLDAAVGVGMAAGALAVTRPGASTSIPDRAEIEAYLARSPSA